MTNALTPPPSLRNLTNHAVMDAFLRGVPLACSKTRSFSVRPVPNGIGLFSYEEILALRVEGERCVDSNGDYAPEARFYYDDRTRYTITTSTHHQSHLWRISAQVGGERVCRERLRRRAGLDPRARRTVVMRGRHTIDTSTGQRLQRAGGF